MKSWKKISKIKLQEKEGEFYNLKNLLEDQKLLSEKQITEIKNKLSETESKSEILRKELKTEESKNEILSNNLHSEKSKSEILEKDFKN